MIIEFTYNNEPVLSDELPSSAIFIHEAMYTKLILKYNEYINFRSVWSILTLQKLCEVSMTQKCNLAKRILCYWNCLFWNSPLVTCKIENFSIGNLQILVGTHFGRTHVDVKCMNNFQLLYNFQAHEMLKNVAMQLAEIWKVFLFESCRPAHLNLLKAKIGIINCCLEFPIMHK